MPRAASQSGRLKAAPTHKVLYPLDRLYEQCGLAPPAVTRTAPERIPPPYRSLLAHEDEMTQTLERHHGRLIIRLLTTATRRDDYFRRVLLVQQATGRPVAMGAVRLRLDVLGGKTRTRLLRGQEPLGRVLRESAGGARSLPAAFFTVVPNAEMMGVFWMPAVRTLYGRQTRLMQDQTRIGDVVEILAAV